MYEENLPTASSFLQLRCPYNSHQLSVVTEHMKCGWSKLCWDTGISYRILKIQNEKIKAKDFITMFMLITHCSNTLGILG